MSKAFTRESDEEHDEVGTGLRPQLPVGLANYITKEGAQRFREELAQLSEKRSQLTGEPSSSDQARIQTRIRHLGQLLTSVVVANPPADRERVAFGARVTVRHPNNEETHYQIVGVDESDPNKDKISWISPLARQLMGHRVGDRVRFRSPAGEEDLVILSVVYENS